MEGRGGGEAQGVADQKNFGSLYLNTQNLFNLPTSDCKYKVWFLEICDIQAKTQVVHLILSEGDASCELTKHLTKECVPSQVHNACVNMYICSYIHICM
jgi:hypothetical protein